MTKFFKLKFIIPIIALLVVIFVILFFALGHRSYSETYDIVIKAIEKTEAQADFLVEISSCAMVTTDETLRRTDTNGYIYARDHLDFVYIYANTASTTPSNPSLDFCVTVALYSDGKQVYDNSTGKEVPIDMSCQEFNDIISEYELYRYEEADVLQVAYEENQQAEYNGGEMTVTLSKPQDAVLEAYARALTEITGEPVGKSALKVILAQVVYSIYDDMVAAQTCNFTVEYQCTDGQTVQYASSAHIVYLEEETNDDFYIPENGEA